MYLEALYLRLRARAQSLVWPAESRTAEIVAVVSGGVLFAAIGHALAWSILYLVLGAGVFAAATWFAGSLTRAVACLFGALGIAAAVVATAVMISESLLATLHVTWGWFAVAWWVLVLVLAMIVSRGNYDRDFGLAEVVGCWVGVVAALGIARKIDYETSLIRYLVHVEDNEAWVGLLTKIGSSNALGPGFAEKFDGRGPIIAMILGLLQHFQEASVPIYNGAFSAYAIVIMLTPLIAAGLLRRCSARSALVLGVFALIVIGWAYRVPFLLFASYGHLTATCAFVFLLAAVAVVAFDKQRAALVPILAGTIFAMGAVWYPIFPIGLAALVVVGWRSWRADAGLARIAALVVVVVTGVVLLAQMAHSVGIVGSSADSGSNVKTLYAAQGGTAALDGSLGLIVLISLVGLAFVPLTMAPQAISTLWRAMIVAVSYVALVFAGAFVAKVGLGYGPTKVWFILGFAVAVVLVSIVARLRLPTRAVVAAVLVLTIGSFLWGGSGDVLSRSWPGGGTDPGWLPPITAVAATENPSAPRPIGCFSNDKYNTYFCTRWGAGLTGASDLPFLDYRLQVMSDQDPTATVDELAASGQLAGSDIVMLELPDEGHAWAWTLIENAGRVYGADGALLDPRPSPPK